MQLEHGQPTFYDECLKSAKRQRERFSRTVGSGLNVILRDNGRDIPITDSLVSEQLNRRLEFLEHCHVFWIDGATADSLYYVEHEKGDYPERIFLPFPRLFFEFEKPIEQQKQIGPKNIKAVLFSNMENSRYVQRFTRNKEDLEKNYYAELLEDRIVDAPFNPVMNFKIEELPNFTFCDINGIYSVDYNSGEVKITQNPLPPGAPLPSTNYQKIEPISRSLEEFDVADHVKKYADLVVNLLDLINAENIVIIKQRRDIPGQDRINKKRSKKGKSQIPQLRPYYWLEVKKTQIQYEDHVDTGRKLEYRVWVRGHHQHYHTNEGIIKRWIIEYIKGPVNAPWRHHRHAVLYKNFRQHLASRGDEDIGAYIDNKEIDNDKKTGEK